MGDHQTEPVGEQLLAEREADFHERLAGQREQNDGAQIQPGQPELPVSAVLGQTQQLLRKKFQGDGLAVGQIFAGDGDSGRRRIGGIAEFSTCTGRGDLPQ